MKLNQITFEQFQETNFYKKRFDKELIQDMRGEAGAVKYMLDTFRYLAFHAEASLVGDKIVFPPHVPLEWVD